MADVEIGDFKFKEKFILSKKINEWIYGEEYKNYNDTALELMSKHFEFFNIINKVMENEAVFRGAKLICTHGNKPIKLDLYKDHGIYDKNAPVMACSDCKVGQNIYSFGACGNDKFEPKYSKKLPAPKESAKDANGNDRQKCLPILDEKWGYGINDKRVFFLNLNANQYEYNESLFQKYDYEKKEYEKVLKKYKKIKNNQNREEYVQILMSNANLLCLYGGIITIEENSEPVKIVTIKENPEEVENIDEAEIVEEVSEPPEREEIEITSWLKAYKGEPDTKTGRRVYYDKKERDELKKINPRIDWYSYEDQTEKNSNCEPYLGDQQFNQIEKGVDVLVDKHMRYWVTLGPRVIDPDYPDTGNCKADYFADSIGCRVDVVLNRIDDEDEYIYIECVWSGNIKAHTLGNGIFQTGHPYPNSSEAIIHPYNEDYVDGSIIEFTGKDIGDNGSMSKYIVDYLIVYPKGYAD